MSKSKKTGKKIVVNAEYDFDLLKAYEVKSIVEEGGELKVTLFKKKLTGLVRLVDAEKSDGNYRFAQVVDGKAVAAFKKNELLFTYDKLGK